MRSKFHLGSISPNFVRQAKNAGAWRLEKNSAVQYRFGGGYDKVSDAVIIFAVAFFQQLFWL
jgi:hypothetical protein